ncbi:MAG: 2-oxoacid:acceptor oxidoreductase subunit alpha [Chloroflexota bacterium]|nr:2-oxoacid:acceptor oxidoreductase subunit alpha [Chloroflexota bacterium]MDE3193650.1 2-oxoacid:acceptor oxidoreductase subunit alpha [Chloroflexota bacterium]
MTPPIRDITIVAAGQGGDGSVTLVSALGELFAGRGYHVYEAREVASRVKGGVAAASLRASVDPKRCLGDATDLLVAFDAAALEQNASALAPHAYVVYDSSEGPAPRGRIPATASVIEAPLSRLAVRDLRRDLYKNSVALGLAARLLGAPDALTEETLTTHLGKLSEQLRAANVRALRAGFAYADEAGLTAGSASWSLDRIEAEERVLMTGNEAIAFGFLAAGGRFFAGYPITPASEILEWLAERLPSFGGVVVQAEDELAAVNMTMGAALTGTRAMTASSGPGIALMQEGVGHAASAEIGIVIVDCQRAGPSTGMPTKPEQSDIGMLISGGNGDIPRIVLAPGDPREAFELTVLACDLADRYQGPVYVASDQALSQNATTIRPPDVRGISPDRGKLLREVDLRDAAEFRRYSLNGYGDGVSPWTAFGTPGGQHLVTGNERDEWGLVTTAPAMRTRMTEKRMRKLETVRDSLPRAVVSGDPKAEIALVGSGLETGVMREAAERLAASGVATKVVQIRTLWPILEDVLEALDGCRAYVVEHNATGQYAAALSAAGAAARVHSILRYDGLPFRPSELVAAVEEKEFA